MKYLNSYETFFESKFNGLINWKNEKFKNAAVSLIKKIKAKMYDTEMKKALMNLRVEYDKLPEVDKAKIQSFKNDKNIPIEIVDINESILMEEESLAIRIVHWLGLTLASVSLVSLILSIIKIVIDGNTYATFFGVNIGTLGAIFMASAFVFGLLSTIGEEEVNRKHEETKE